MNICCCSKLFRMKDALQEKGHWSGHYYGGSKKGTFGLVNGTSAMVELNYITRSHKSMVAGYSWW